MKQSLCRFLLLWFAGSSAAFCQVYLTQSPQFAEAGQAVPIRAFVESTPTAVTLTWIGGSETGSLDMAFNAGGCWTATIPADAVAGTELTYTVTANDDQGSTASPDCTLAICPAYTVLEPKPMTLRQATLAETVWNGSDRAFGLLKPENGPPIGPASIAYHKGRIYLLDSVNERILSFSKANKTRTEVPIATSFGSDLVVDPTNDSLLVISQLEDKIYRIRKGKVSKTVPVPLKKSFEYPAQFVFDRGTQSLHTQQQNHRGKRAAVMSNNVSVQTADQPIKQNLPVLTDVQGHQLQVKADSNPQVFAIAFQQPVGFIDEAVVDDNGVVWVLYTLQGDYRVRRLARIDTVTAQAETALIDIWFSFDATRRMAATDTGVVLMTGDETQGRIVTFDYTGGVQ
jgi:hypothetical protein